MTKGANFQARIDLTNQRREAAKALKAAKAAGLVIEPDALMIKILLLDPGTLTGGNHLKHTTTNT
jgi:hypothetical protein